MKECTKCGASNRDEARICTLCKAPFQTSAAKTCPNGHTMDPNWTECIYCKSAGSVVPPRAARPAVPPEPFLGAVSSPIERDETVVETSDRNAAASSVPLRSRTAYDPMVPHRVTAPPSQPSARDRNKTIFDPGGSKTKEGRLQSTPQVPPGRRIVGVLVTYSWHPEGKIHPVYEGRNYIGRTAECEITIPDDPMMSELNSTIVYRRNFIISDNVSMNGTDLDGEPVEVNSAKVVPNYGVIRAGSTSFTFIAVQPLGGQVASASSPLES